MTTMFVLVAIGVFEGALISNLLLRGRLTAVFDARSGSLRCSDRLAPLQSAASTN
jgi:hypothetical protein